MRIPSAKWIGVSVIGLVFATWAAVFVYRSSFIAIDGQRYFCLFDDSMISMRYAWNLAHGNGLVWNPGERVEGITNLLMTLFMSVPTGLLDKSGAVLAIQVWGVVLLLAIALVTMKIGEALLARTELRDRSLLSVLFFTCALAYYPLNFWTLMGMETGLLTLLLLSAVWVAFRVDGNPTPSPALAVLLGLAFATRPDAAIPIALIMLHRLTGIYRRPGWVRGLLTESATIAAFVAAVSGFRWLYYGSLVPNTYTLKVEGLPLALRLENGLAFNGPFLSSLLLPVSVGALALILRWHRHTALLVALLLSSMAYEIWVGGDAWPYWRINAPFVPPIFVVCLVELGVLIHRYGPRLLPGRLAAASRLPVLESAALVLVLLAQLGAANASFQGEMFLSEPAYHVKSNWRNVNTSVALNEVTKPTATVGVFWGGTIPYYTGLRGVDFLGKSDAHIASLPPDIQSRRFGKTPGHNKYDLDYSIVRLQPTYVQNFHWGTQNVGAFVRAHYRNVPYKGVRLTLKNGSADVDWERLSANRRAVRQPERRGDRQPERRAERSGPGC